MPIILHNNNKYDIPDDVLSRYLIKDDVKKDYEIYCQRDPRWNNERLGNGNTTIGSHGCFLTSLAMMVKQTPTAINKSLKKYGGFYKDLIISKKAAEILGLEYNGKEYNISKMPQYSPSIKEVTMARSQHFVLRIIEKDNQVASKYGTLMVDPWTGSYQKINYYPFKSYRLFKKK